MAEIIHDLTSPESVAAQEANMVAYWSNFGRTERGERYAGNDLVRFMSGIGDHHMNGVMAARLTEEALDSTIVATRDYFSAHQVPMLWWVGPSTQPSDIGTHLERHGFVAAGNLPLMAVDLQAMNEKQPSPANLRIAMVEDTTTLAAWVQIMGTCFGFSGAAEKDYIALEASMGFANDKSWVRFIGYLDDRPVATSGLLLNAGVAGIYNVGTLPDVRGQGIGAAITLAPLRVARERGYRIGTRQATPMGRPVYLRLGFHELAPLWIYRWPSEPESPDTPQSH